MAESETDKLTPRVEDLLFRSMGSTRYTQDSPILPDVWLAYAKNPKGAIEMLLTAHRDSDPAELAFCLRQRLNAYLVKTKSRAKTKARQRWRVAYNETAVIANLTFFEVISVALPLTKWWGKYLVHGEDSVVSAFLKSPEKYRKLLRNWFSNDEPSNDESSDDESSDDESSDDQARVDLESEADLAEKLRLPSVGRNLRWLAQMVALFVDIETHDKTDSETKPDPEVLADRVIRVLNNAILPGIDSDALSRQKYQRKNRHQLWSINVNRTTEPSVYRSVRAVKADATQSLFDVRGDEICWAVIDSGIDATHFAFRKRDPDGLPLGPGNGKDPIHFENGNPLQNGKRIGEDTGAFVQHDKTKKWINQTRIVKTLDFSLMRDIISSEGKKSLLPEEVLDKASHLGIEKDLRTALKFNRVIDWELLEPLLEVPHTDQYKAPHHHHGTHVAGIIGADWHAGEHQLSPPGGRCGVAPRISLYDLRGLGGKDGTGDEFTILAAMQYVRSLNARNNQMQIHGVNLSFSIRHQVANYGCGRTPVCIEAERLVGSGVVVVAAAGNLGRASYVTKGGVVEGYCAVSITDPGNAEAVITVGATHRYKPHDYGVSYFSSRGPTGDGRIKPDIVAPGEKIFSTIPDNKEVELDGTSMAAPHVSGAAALLMDRNVELIGQPRRIKQVLCDAATDLGRERYFQGAGMLDTLRSLQSV